MFRPDEGPVQAGDSTLQILSSSRADLAAPSAEKCSGRGSVPPLESLVRYLYKI